MRRRIRQRCRTRRKRDAILQSLRVAVGPNISVGRRSEYEWEVLLVSTWGETATKVAVADSTGAILTRDSMATESQGRTGRPLFGLPWRW